MVTLESRAKGGTWGLRARLLVPIFGLAVLIAVVLAVIGHFSARQQGESLVHQRGNTVLEGVTEQVEERQRAKEIFAQLLAGDDRLISAVEAGDKVGAAQVLVPLKTELDLGFVDVHDREGKEFTYLGEREEPLMDPLVDPALSGLTQSSAVVGDEGLQISAATPIKGPQGIIGVVVVGDILDGEALGELKGRDDVELATYRDGRLAAASIEQPDLVSLLGKYESEPESEEKLHRELESNKLHPTVKSLGNGGDLLALVPYEDLEQSAQRRNLAVLVSSLLLLSILLAVVTILTRNITRPLARIVAVTKDIVRGDYDRRAEPGKIRELNELGSAINHLAQQIEVQIVALQHQAFHDPLTNLPNRTLLTERLEHALAWGNRLDGEFVGLLFVDLDNFKIVNDSLGHQVGDRMLVEAAERFSACVRPGDTVARLGGDEFVFLLENIGEPGEAVRVAERIARELRTPFTLGEYRTVVTASIGIALSVPGQKDLPEDLLRNADVALYEAKNGGKNRYAIFNAGMYSRVWERLQLENEIRQAIAEGQFRVHYQPEVLLESGEVVGFEALVRWEHPERGLVLPDEFIPVAEETGLIVPLENFVLREACRQLVEWSGQHRLDRTLKISVNLSARQFRQKDLVSNVSQILSDTGVDPTCLVLEITESVVMHDVSLAVAVMQELKAVGIQIAIDDFGTGHSSLSYLKRFPIDYLKIDRAFVSDLGEEFGDAEIVEAVIRLAHAMGLRAIAEGVETHEQLVRLYEMGCKAAQGYYFCEPLPAREIPQILNKRFSLA